MSHDALDRAFDAAVARDDDHDIRHGLAPDAVIGGRAVYIKTPSVGSSTRQADFYGHLIPGTRRTV